ncbi:MAG: WhiB family transcriptional regulator [Actinobacteria bacterium]|jgi:WhiB family transcriptional regulator, redox-sensing transcriptional regulator|nr:WhiB family transcriptional regulator [Actinomycetota bacterium]
MFAEVSKPDDSWRDAAACRGCPPAMFFPVDETDDDAPKAVCAACAVRADCLLDALLARETQGVRGGLNERERKSLVRRVRRNVRLGRSAGLLAAVSSVAPPERPRRSA